VRSLIVARSLSAAAAARAAESSGCDVCIDPAARCAGSLLIGFVAGMSGSPTSALTSKSARRLGATALAACSTSFIPPATTGVVAFGSELLQSRVLNPLTTAGLAFVYALISCWVAGLYPALCR
jgi:hypothetical protein